MDGKNSRIEDIEETGGTEYARDAECRHPEHNPPTHVYIPVGKRLVHVCPGCGHETRIENRGYGQTLKTVKG
jgi:hypothetical protein